MHLFKTFSIHLTGTIVARITPRHVTWCLSSWPCSLMRRSAAARLLVSRVWIPLRALRSFLVFVWCCVGSCLSDHSFRGFLPCVRARACLRACARACACMRARVCVCLCLIVCYLATLTMRRTRPDLGLLRHKNGICWSQWPRGLRRRSAAERLLGLRVRNPLIAWIFFSCTFFLCR
jgi:hypothetical protein